MSGAIPPCPPDAVRVLHTSDWHLGAKVRNEPRRSDHDALIAEIVEIAATAGPDLILHTGDLFDGERPPMADFGRAISALRTLGEIAPVAVLAGNHDSPIALDVLAIAVDDHHSDDVEAGRFDPVTAEAARIRVHSRPTLAERGAVTTYATQAGVNLRLVALPFVHQNRVVKDFAALLEANATYNDNLRKIVASYSGLAFSAFDPTRDVAVFASHLHVRDARTSSEKVIHIAEDYATDPAHFEPRYGYLAFGHIHVPQPVADGRGQYAGSVIEVDFGEEGEQKRVVVADLIAGRPTKVTSVPLSSGRRLRRLRAPLSELADRAHDVGSDIVEVTVIAEPEVSDQPASAGPAGAAAADQIIVGDRTFDTLSAAVHFLMPDAAVVGVIDGRNPARQSLDEVEQPRAVETVGDAFRVWLRASGGPVVAANGGSLVDPARVAGLFDELHAAVTTDSPTILAETEALGAFSDGSER